MDCQKMSKMEWTSKQLAVMQALANPQDGRSHGQIAIDLGIAQETVSRWKKLPGFSQAVYDLALLNVSTRLAKVLNTLANSAESGNVPASRLLLEITGKIRPGGIQNVISGQVNIGKESLGDVIDESELRKIADAIISQPA